MENQFEKKQWCKPQVSEITVKMTEKYWTKSGSGSDHTHPGTGTGVGVWHSHS
jgi:hypothetical protein